MGVEFFPRRGQSKQIGHVLPQFAMVLVDKNGKEICDGLRNAHEWVSRQW